MPGDGSQDLVVAGRRLRKKLVVALTLSSAVPLLVLAYVVRAFVLPSRAARESLVFGGVQALVAFTNESPAARDGRDRQSTRLNSSHASISYAVFRLNKQTP